MGIPRPQFPDQLLSAWDFPADRRARRAAPLLIGGTDKDGLFHWSYLIDDKVRRIYQLHKANDKLGLVMAPGPHDEVPELQLAGFNRHSKGEEKPIEMAVKSFLPRSNSARSLEDRRTL
ncbi:MAG: hypothetical protein QM813_21460 [Verrucomicrobiota bacterium]